MQVRIVNLTPQLITTSVLDESGSLKEMRLEGRAKSEPIDESKLSEHVHQLVAARRLSLRAA